MINTTLCTVETVQCCSCGIIYGLESAHRQSLRNTGATFYCSNGHPQVYGNTLVDKNQKLQAELTAAKCDIAKERQAKWDALDAVSKAEMATIRLKRRISAGICPCCNRSFQNLRRHMQTKHPKGT